MAVPYTFGTATASIPLSQLDSNFATVITLGNTAIQLGNTVTTLNNMTLANVTISSGNVTLTNVTITTANVTTANVVTLIVTGNETVQGNTTVTGTITGAKLIPTGSSVTGNGMYLPAANSVGISTNGTNAVYIDSTQKVGIGAISSGATLAVTGTLSATGTLSGGTSGTGYSFSGSAPATSLTLDSSGNLGLGVTPSAWRTDFNQRALQLNNASFSTFNDNSLYVVQNGYLSSTGWKYTSTDAASQYIQSVGAHSWQTAPSGTAGNAITFTQAMTLDSSGNLLVGDTSAYSGSRLSVKTGNNNGTTHAWYAKNSSATVLGYQRDDGLFNTGAATNSPYNFTTGSAANLFVDASGTFYRSTSSLKYKTNVQDATHGLAALLQLRSVTYEGKAETDAGKTFGGLIAEEVHAVGLTEFVQYAEDGSPDALAYGNMVSLCIKAIQEQQALITTLTARITALETA